MPTRRPNSRVRCSWWQKPQRSAISAIGNALRSSDRLDGRTYTIRAHYLLGADGGRSLIAEQIGLPMQGRMGVGGSMNILLEADLSRYVAHRPSVLYWVLQPGANIGGIGMGLVRMVRPWNEWLIVWGYDVGQPAPVVDDATAEAIARSLIGDDSVPIRIKSSSVWTVNPMNATKYGKGRVFCMGDAVHRHPPSNGLGSNTSIQDAYNIAWKLALVLRGTADPSLLDSYQPERAPIGKQIVDRANKSIEEYAPVFDALGLLQACDPQTMRASMRARTENTPAAAAQRAALRTAIAAKTYEFNAHGVETNQRYVSDAVIGDGSAEPAFAKDAELYYHATTWPGARLPHAWVFRDGQAVSTLDLVRTGRFALLTGIGGEDWRDAAREAGARWGLEIDVVVIGPGRDYEDLFGDWAALSEIEEAGCVLVRPDRHVAWRTQSAQHAVEALDAVVARLLGRT